jgi:Arc/MetJ family transcription regulator
MRATIVLDDELVAEAAELTGINGKTALVRKALTLLVERESSRSLAELGGTQPDLVVPSRSRLI